MMQIDLLKAISKGDSVQRVIEILDANPTAIHQYDGRPTPLMSAAKYGRKSVVRHLIATKCSVDDVDKDRKTALSIASNYGHVDVISSLLDAGANIDHQDIHGVTPLMICAQSGRVASVQLLLQRGANKDITRTADSKRAIDLTSSTELRVILSLNNKPKYRALFADGAVTPLGNELFEFSTRKLTYIQCVNISMSSGMVENIPCLSCDASELNGTHVITLFSESCGNDKNGIILKCANLGGDYVVDSSRSNSSSNNNSSSSSSSCNSNSSSGISASHRNPVFSDLPNEGPNPAAIPVILKLSTNFENIRKEVEMLQKFQNVFRLEISPFIRLADKNSGIIYFEKVDTGDVIHGKNNNSGDSGNVSILDEVDVKTTEGKRQLHSRNIETFDTKNDLRMANIEKPDKTSNSANWTGFLIEKGFCDLHKLGTEFLAINDTRSTFTHRLTHRFVKNKIPRTSYGDFKLNVSDGVCADSLYELNYSRCDHDSIYEKNGKWISSSNKASKGLEITAPHDPQSLFHSDLDKLNLIFNFATQICSCVAVLHDMGYVWLDLKPANFVIFVMKNITEREFESENKTKKGNENENEKQTLNEIENEKRDKECYEHINVTNINQNITTTEISKNADNDKEEKFRWNFNEIFSHNSGFSFLIKAIDLGGCSVVNTTHDICTLTFTAKFMAPELAQLIISNNDDTSDMKHISTNIVRDGGNEDRSEDYHECKIDNNANHDIDNDYHPHHHNNDDNVNEADPTNPRRMIEYTVSTAYDSWSLGICLLQLFHKDFKCFFSDLKKETKNEEEIKSENDGDKKCSHKSKNSDLVLQKLASSGHLLQSEINEYLSNFVRIKDTVTNNRNNSDDDDSNRNDNYHCSNRYAICYDDDDDKKCGLNSIGNKCNRCNECVDDDNLSNNQKAKYSNLDHMVIQEKNAQKFKKNVLNVIRKLLQVNSSERISVKEAHSMMMSSSLFN